MGEPDDILVRRALGGSRLAAGQLAERHRAGAYAAAYGALRNADDAGDVAQEALIYALLRLPDLRDPTRFGAWVKQLARSHAVDYRRRRATRRLGDPLEAVAAAACGDSRDDRLVLRQAVDRLPALQRAALLLHYVEGWSLDEVAEQAGVPRNTVRSRLGAAMRALRVGLGVPREERLPMSAQSTVLPDGVAALLAGAMPGATPIGTEAIREQYMPFAPRVRLAMPDGTERVVDIRRDIDPDRAALLPTLAAAGVPGPRLVYGPVPDAAGGYLSVCEPPRGENLHLWALGGTPHRIRLATERAFEAVDRLQAATPAVLATPAGRRLPRLTLSDEAEALAALRNPWRDDEWFADRIARADAGPWHDDPWFRDALVRTRRAAADVRDPLVFTHYLHFQPNFARIEVGPVPFDRPLGWPGDARMEANPLAEIVHPFGYLGDPLVGLAMVWVYDCYPFVHAGFVEQFLWRRNVSRREFAPRLALRALQTMAREVPVERPGEGGEYWDALHGYVEQAYAWMA